MNGPLVFAVEILLVLALAALAAGVYLGAPGPELDVRLRELVRPYLEHQRDIAQGLGISDAALKDWKGQHLSRSNGKDLITHELELENQKLRRELERVTTQRDILKKSLGILSEEPPQKDMPK